MTQEEKKLSEQAIEFFKKKDYDKSKSLYEEILKKFDRKNYNSLFMPMRITFIPTTEAAGSPLHELFETFSNVYT